MLESKTGAVHWLHLDADARGVWKKLLNFFSDDCWETFAGTLQLGLYDTSGGVGVVWNDSRNTSVAAVLEQIVQACKQERRFSVTCRYEDVTYTFLPPSREGSTVSHPLWQVLVARKEVLQLSCTDALAERLRACGFVE